MTNVLVYNFFGKNNIGDDVYPMVFRELFPKKVLRFTCDPTEKDINWCDEVILGGGNILNHAFLSKINVLLHDHPKPLKAFSVGYAEDQNISAQDFRHFSRIAVRDLKSQNKLASSLKIDSDLVPDAAWMLVPDATAGKERWQTVFETNKAKLYQKKVAIILNGYLTFGNPDQLSREALRFQLFVHQMAEILDHTNASFLFLPFSTGMPADDRVPNGWLANKCKWFRKNVVLWNSEGVQGSLDLIAGADLVVSMRYHSSVFSLIAGTELIDIWHHDKNRGLLEVENKIENGISYWDFSKERMNMLLEKSLNKGVEIDGTSSRRRWERREQIVAYSKTM